MFGWILKRLIGGRAATPAGPGEPEEPRLVPQRPCPECQWLYVTAAPACPYCRAQRLGAEVQTATPGGDTTRKRRLPADDFGLAGITTARKLAAQHGARAFLFVFQGQEKGKSLFLRTSAASLGREASNRLPLADDGVSKKHAEVRPVDAGGFQIVDTGSRNGVFVNDEQAKEKGLEEGDVIGVGEARVFFGVV